MMRSIPEPTFHSHIYLANFFMMNQIKEGQNSEYAQNFVSYRGLKTVVSYNINARTVLNMYVSVEYSAMEKMQIDDYPTRFDERQNVYDKEYLRTPRLDMPFSENAFDGIIFLDEL